MEFSSQERRYLNDRDFLLAKNEIIDKVVTLMGRIEKQLKIKIESSNYHFPPGVLSRSGKISRGENYQGLPYVILDYPRKFTGENIFAFRTMFWWGHFVSATLHLGGTDWENKREVLLDHRHLLEHGDWYICVNQYPWEYHYQVQNYLLWDAVPEAQKLELLKRHHFLKLSRRWKLSENQLTEQLVVDTFNSAMTFLQEPV